MNALSILCAWLFFIAIGLVVHRKVTRADAIRRLRPELIEIREVLDAAVKSGEIHFRAKCAYAISLLDELK